MGKRSRSARIRCAAVEALEKRQLMAAVPTPAHVVIVMNENKNYGQVIGDPDAAYSNSLARNGALFTNSHGIGHPSQPNYIALFSGSTQGVTDDNGPVSFTGANLATELSGAGLTFAGYSEDLPAVGSQVLTYADYAKRHNPWSDFTNVPAADNQPFSAFPTNFNNLPTVSFVIPNLDDDMHDGTIAEGDAWLQQNIGAYATWAKTHNSLLIYTFDEDDDTDTTNQIPTIIYGQGVQTGSYGENITHYNVLRTIEDMYGIGRLGNSSSASPITDIWSSTGTGGTTPPANTTYISALTWTSATVGYSTIKKDASINGNTITLRGQTYLNGIGTHAASTITYNLNGLYNEFTSDVGIDDEVIAEGGLGSVDFQVVGDGKTLYDSGKLTASSAIAHVDVSVAGVKTLQLVATNGISGNIDYDHADWAGAALLQAAATPTAPTAPINLAAAAVSSSEIDLSWTNTANNQTAFEVDRSTDGTNFTPLTTALAASSLIYKDTTAAAGTKYYYRVIASNSAGSSPASNIANATTLAANTVVVYVSDLTWSSATVGYGTIQKDKSINGQTIALRGAKYSKGIGTHAASTITYNIAGLYSNFISDVGIDDEVTGQGSVDFQVIGDGKVLFDSGKLTGASPVVHINVSVAGVKTLQLVATNGISGSIDYDHADWAGAQLVGAPSAPTAPSNLVAAAVSSSEIDLNWTNTAVNQSGFEIDRSSDGTNFTPLKNVASTVTSYQDTGLSLSTKYYYRVEATNSLGASPSSNIVNATTLATTPVTTYLSSLTWASATTGYGTIQKDKSINGLTITLNGVTYTKGIGTHALSKIVYNLAGQYTSFVSDVGLDDEVGDEGSVDFQVLGDGKVLFDSGIMGGLSATQSFNINVTGVQQLTLVATNGVAGDIDFDHADWAGARLLGNPTVPGVPTNLIATPFSSSQINLSWTPTSTNQTGFEIDRSTDSTNFTMVTTVPATASTYSDIGRTASTKYYYRVEAVNTLGPSQASAVVSATTLSATSTTTYLSDLTWTSATVGYATIQKDKNINGNTISLRGTTYTKGIGTHANSTITYNLAGKYKTFSSDIGIDDEVNGQGSVTFQVIGDGKVLYTSGTITGASPIVHISNLNVTGVTTLQLVVTTTITGNIDFDHADWANALLTT